MEKRNKSCGTMTKQEMHKVLMKFSEYETVAIAI